jgi:hypothetical protein
MRWFSQVPAPLHADRSVAEVQSKSRRSVVLVAVGLLAGVAGWIVNGPITLGLIAVAGAVAYAVLPGVGGFVAAWVGAAGAYIPYLVLYVSSRPALDAQFDALIPVVALAWIALTGVVAACGWTVAWIANRTGLTRTRPR